MENDLRWGEDSGLLARVLDSIESLIDHVGPPDPPEAAQAVLCRLCGDLVHASAAAHVRYDGTVGAARLCLWHASEPDLPSHVVQFEQSPASSGPEWWHVSRSRIVTYDWIGERHLAELPLSTQVSPASLIVVGRNRPFTESDTQILAEARRSLVILERLSLHLTVPEAEPGRPAPRASAVEVGLTARELEVLTMLSEGMLARTIAVRLHVSERTVHKHLGSLYRKLEVHDRLLAVRQGELLGLLPTPFHEVTEPPGTGTTW